jgi:hypothetical protein
MDEEHAMQRGMVAACRGDHGGLRLGWALDASARRISNPSRKQPRRRKKTTITAESFDRQAEHKIGDDFFGQVFLPLMKKLVEAHLSYEEVKRIVAIPSTWGAKISGEQFRERALRYFEKQQSGTSKQGVKKS